MPWYRTSDTIPPIGKEIVVFGSNEKKKYEAYDVFDGKGGIRKDFPKWWSYELNLPDPPEIKDKGIDHVEDVKLQEDVVDPKIVKGKKPPPGPDFLGEGSLDNR